MFFAFNLEHFTQDRIFYTGTACGACNKYEVWMMMMMIGCFVVLFSKHDDIIAEIYVTKHYSLVV